MQCVLRGVVKRGTALTGRVGGWRRGRILMLQEVIVMDNRTQGWHER